MHAFPRLVSPGVVMLAWLLACESAGEAPPVDTAFVTPTLPPDTAAIPTIATSAWDRSAGSVLAIPGSAPGEALMVFPELTDTTLTDTVLFASSRVEGLALDLFDRSGLVTADTVMRMPAHAWTAGCMDWPRATLRGAPLRWTVGFAAGRVTPVPLDSIEGMPAQDSSVLAAALAREASNLPDAHGSRFHGVPFLVRAAYRFRADDGSAVVIADLVRRLPLEANPQEEHTFLVAHRDSVNVPFRVVYHDRRSGSEEAFDAIELLGAVRMGSPPHPALVLARVGDETTAYTLLELVAPGRWQTRWTSVTTTC
ncbi:MAG TPA: hypothetical protein VMM77_00735 [Gemmatimonadaceae bacterium]|nr:hypothetical protein [Gemmatimonadaceae bacterium]